MNKPENQDTIHIRGRISSTDTCFGLCSAAPEKKVFQTMLELANEAITVRQYLERFGAKHKLAPMLIGQSSVECISFLMGATHHDVAVTQSLDLSDKARNERSITRMKVNEGVPEANKGTTNGELKVENGILELDDETLDAFSTFPGME